MLIPGKKWVSIMIPVAIIVSMVAQHAIAVMVAITIPVVIPPLDSVIPVFALVVATALRQPRTGSQSQAQQHYQSHPESLAHNASLLYLMHFEAPAGEDK